MQLDNRVLLIRKVYCIQNIDCVRDMPTLRPLSWLSDHGFGENACVPFTMEHLIITAYCEISASRTSLDMFFAVVLILLLNNRKYSKVYLYSKNEHSLSVSHWNYKLEGRTFHGLAACSNWIK